MRVTLVNTRDLLGGAERCSYDLARTLHRRGDRVELIVGPAFAGTLTADTSVGRVTVGPFPDGIDANIVAKDKTDAKIVFGGRKGPKSNVDTSVGSVTIKGHAGGEARSERPGEPV